MANPTVADIVKQYLIQHEYDGLACDYCSCEVSDLMACDEEQFSYNCWAGYKVPCPGEGVCDIGGDCDWHIGKERR